ncbi:MAG: FecR domain-containing protein [Verrucomicrobiota bacterium]
MHRTEDDRGGRGMNELSPQARLEELLVASVESSFASSERDELNLLLRENREARRFASNFLRLDAVLSETLVAEEAERQFTPEITKEAPEKDVRFTPVTKGWAAGIAAVLMVGLWLARPAGAPVATVSSAQRVTGFSSGLELSAGDWMRFERGWVALKFESGAKLAVEGPAEFQITGGNGAIMNRGKATVRVPGRIKGFTLETPSERVVDLGTAFGVAVEENGATSVAVFEGEIELQGEGQKSGTRRLLVGASVRVNEKNQKPIEIPYEESSYLETWQASFGVEAVQGDLRIAKPRERSAPGEVLDSNSLLLFPERESVELPGGFALSTLEPGQFNNEMKPRAAKLETTLSASRLVDSFLLQFNPDPEGSQSESQNFSGSLRFERPIVGLILNRELLDASDNTLGLSGADFEGVFRRGINMDDRISLHPDRRTLSLSFFVGDGVDQIRVLVASDPD